MKRSVAVGVLALLLALGFLRDEAVAHVDVAVGVNLPGFGAVVTTGPVWAPYPYPYPVYGPPVVYRPVVYPRPRYYAPRPAHRHHHKHHKHHRGCD